MCDLHSSADSDELRWVCVDRDKDTQTGDKYAVMRQQSLQILLLLRKTEEMNCKELSIVFQPAY